MFPAQQQQQSVSVVAVVNVEVGWFDDGEASTEGKGKEDLVTRAKGPSENSKHRRSTYVEGNECEKRRIMGQRNEIRYIFIKSCMQTKIIFQ